MSLPDCPKCKSEYVYEMPPLLVCPECAHEWDPLIKDDEITATDAVGNTLHSGDRIFIAKDIKVKGSSKGVKIGTKAVIRNIRERADHELDCRVDGAGEMYITAKFVKRISGA